MGVSVGSRIQLQYIPMIGRTLEPGDFGVVLAINKFLSWEDFRSFVSLEVKWVDNRHSRVDQEWVLPTPEDAYEHAVRMSKSHNLLKKVLK